MVSDFCFVLFCWERASYSPSWPWTCCVAKNNLEFLISWLYLPVPWFQVHTPEPRRCQRKEDLSIFSVVLWLRLRELLGSRSLRYQGREVHLLQISDVCLVSASKRTHQWVLPWLRCQMQSQGKPRPCPRASRPAEGMLCDMCALRDNQGLLRAVPQKNPSSFYTPHVFLQTLSMNDNSTKEITRSCHRDQIAKEIVVSFVQQGIFQTFPSNEHLSRGQQNGRHPAE